MKKSSYKALQKRYGGMYVLMDKPNGKVIVVSKNLEEAFKGAEKKGYKVPAVQYIEPTNRIVIYEIQISLRS